jgi:transposase
MSRPMLNARPQEHEATPIDVASLLALLDEKTRALEESQANVERLIEMLRLMKQKRFGASSEKSADSRQLGIFNEAEELSSQNGDDDDEKDEADAAADVAPPPARKRPKRKKLPQELPREQRVIELPESERLCPEHGLPMQEIGRDVSERLEVIPMTAKVIEEIKIKYACKCGGCDAAPMTAPPPASIVPKGIPTESTLAAVATWKYVDALPLYRIEEIFRRSGIDVSRASLASWMIKTGRALQPLVNLLVDGCLESDYLQMDETRTQVLKEKNKRAESQSFMWALARPGPDPIAVFEYDPTRSGAVARRLLEGFKGYLQTDAYSGYDQFDVEGGPVRLGGCLTHARRKFKDAATAAPAKAGHANKAMKYIKKLYAIEDLAREKPPDERHRIRLKLAPPILDAFHAWLAETLPKVPPKTETGKALKYLSNQWPYIVRYLEDGRYELDTNFVENAIRPFAVGRKNWLFSDSVEGAEASANIYSLTTTAKMNGLEPYRYLRYVLERLPSAGGVDDFAALLPAAVKVVFADQAR